MSYPRFRGRFYTCGNFGNKSTDYPNKKYHPENETNKKGEKLTANVRTVEDGVTNAQTAGTTRKSKRDRKITAKMQMSLQKQKWTKM